VRKFLSIFVLLAASVLLGACSMISTGGSGGVVVPTTGNTSTDPSAVQQFLPNIPGYIATDADSIVDAVTAVGGGASLITGNPITAALIAQIDSMIQCYQNVGAVGARIYTQADISSVLQGNIPVVGALALVNQNRIANNFLQCALGGLQGFSAQAAEPQPCTGSGQFVVNNETILYLYAATDQALCTQFQGYMNR